jgi:hypothetical protein
MVLADLRMRGHLGLSEVAPGELLDELLAGFAPALDGAVVDRGRRDFAEVEVRREPGRALLGGKVAALQIGRDRAGKGVELLGCVFLTAIDR